MIALLFFSIAFLFVLQTLYFLWRWLLHRRLPSLICAAYPVGWVLVVARELKLLPRPATTLLISISLCVGIVAVLIILHHESQQVHPFR